MPIEFSPGQIEQLARVLGDCGTGSEISDAFSYLGIRDLSGESTKWRRLRWAFTQSQQRDRSINEVLKFMEVFLDPARFAGRDEVFQGNREALNTILAFAGLEFRADGKTYTRPIARTITEAQTRAETIRAKLGDSRIHPEVLKYCDAELMTDNYFHAVFEATKGLARRIQDLSGVELGGEKLVQRAFLGSSPKLAFNPLRTQTEKDEQRGLSMLIQGCFVAIRNPLAHEPKILWDDEVDAADCLALISFLHRKLDNALPTGLGSV
ncbi:MAG: TIGR02391 family protein [Chloroflexi bacterium]|nr:TIGR02391 family protein [Chloroflexota bacterium]